MGYIKELRHLNLTWGVLLPKFLTSNTKYLSILILSIGFTVFTTSSVSCQRDSVLLKGQYVAGTSFSFFGIIDLSDFGKPTDITWFHYNLRLRGHRFIFNRFAAGVGINYFSYYFAQPGYDFRKPWNAEVYLRYYPFKYVYIEPNIIYGGFVKEGSLINENKIYLTGGLSLGFEFKIKDNIYLEFDIKAFYGISKNTWIGKFGSTGDMFLGVNYYFDKK